MHFNSGVSIILILKSELSDLQFPKSKLREIGGHKAAGPQGQPGCRRIMLVDEKTDCLGTVPAFSKK